MSLHKRAQLKIIYIDNNENVGTTFIQLASRCSSLSSMGLSNGKMAIVPLMDLVERPEVIIVNCALVDVPCKMLVQYIRKQEKFAHTKVVVVGDHFTDKEKRTYASLGAGECVSNWSSIASVNAFIMDLALLSR